MRNFSKTKLIFLTSLLLMIGLLSFIAKEDNKIISYECNPKKEMIKFYWKDDKGKIIRSIDELKKQLSQKGENLFFATNGGMYKKDNSPQGLFIQDKVIRNSLDTLDGNGNFI